MNALFVALLGFFGIFLSFAPVGLADVYSEQLYWIGCRMPLETTSQKADLAR
jgi:hypothetical protein